MDGEPSLKQLRWRDKMESRKRSQPASTILDRREASNPSRTLQALQGRPGRGEDNIDDGAEPGARRRWDGGVGCLEQSRGL
jgi:hypothetical protein